MTTERQTGPEPSKDAPGRAALDAVEPEPRAPTAATEDVVPAGSQGEVTPPAPAPAAASARSRARTKPKSPERPSAPAAEEPPPSTGSVTLHTVPWADIFLDGKRLGTTPERIELPPGTHRLRLSNPRARLEHVEVVEVVAGGEVRRNLKLMGAVRLRVKGWGEVRVDGEVRGTTPLPDLDLAAGPHDVEVASPESGRRERRRVVVEPGKTVTLKLDLTAP